MNKIRILVVEPNKKPYQIKIEHTVENMQNIVNGLIDYIELEHNVDLIFNEEFYILKLPFNKIVKNNIICGTFFIAGQHDGNTISLSRKQIKKYKKIFAVDNKAYCPKCYGTLEKSDLKDYDFLCLNCDENFYNIEVYK